MMHFPKIFILIKFILQEKIFSAFEKDPLFTQSLSKLSLEDARRVCFQRVKRLYEYDFLNGESN